MTALIVIIVIVVLGLLIIAGLYNGLVSSRNRVDEAWSDINVQLKRRYDLIPNLVNTVKGYASHESGVLEAVTNARTQAQTAGSMAGKLAAENNLTRAIGGIFAVAENYPQLKANENFAQLQSDLTDTEDKIQAARRFYNGNVRDYNTKLQVFPTNIFANIFSFKPRDMFGLDDATTESKVPTVSF
jgi:LemA protein